MRKLLILTSVFLAACSLAPKYERPAMDLPPTADEDFSIFTQEKWWAIFNDDVLNALEDTALAFNKDLTAAMARVDQARAEAGIATADRMPQIGYKVSDASASSAHVGVSASYELDLWGKYRSQSAAARARLLESEAQRDVVRLTLTSDVAKTYFNIRTLDAQIAVAARTLAAREESVRIYKVRYENGLVGELDLRRIEAERDGVKAQMLEMQKALSKNESALAVLVGSSPRDIVKSDLQRGKELAEITLVPDIPANVPSTILERRPDVRAAEYRLMAANADVGVARAAFFPTIGLTADGGAQSSALMDLFTGGAWNFAASLAGPLFRGGELKNTLEEYSARERELAAAYEKAVQVAFKETYDALNANRIDRQTASARRAQTEALGRSLELVNKQYDAGLVSLLDVLDVERGFLGAQIEEATAMQNELNAVVDVSKALGGGFN